MQEARAQGKTETETQNPTTASQQEDTPSVLVEGRQVQGPTGDHQPDVSMPDSTPHQASTVPPEPYNREADGTPPHPPKQQHPSTDDSTPATSAGAEEAAQKDPDLQGSGLGGVVLQAEEDEYSPSVSQRGPPKEKLKWTMDIRRLLQDAIDKVGGLEGATPKKVLDHIEGSGITIAQVKSFLQKRRLQEERRKQKGISRSRSEAFIQQRGHGATDSVGKDEVENARGGTVGAPQESPGAGVQVQWIRTESDVADAARGGELAESQDAVLQLPAQQHLADSREFQAPGPHGSCRTGEPRGEDYLGTVPAQGWHPVQDLRSTAGPKELDRGFAGAPLPLGDVPGGAATLGMTGLSHPHLGQPVLPLKRDSSPSSPFPGTQRPDAPPDSVPIGGSPHQAGFREQGLYPQPPYGGAGQSPLAGGKRRLGGDEEAQGSPGYANVGQAVSHPGMGSQAGTCLPGLGKSSQVQEVSDEWHVASIHESPGILEEEGGIPPSDLQCRQEGANQGAVGSPITVTHQRSTESIPGRGEGRQQVLMQAPALQHSASGGASASGQAPELGPVLSQQLLFHQRKLRDLQEQLRRHMAQASETISPSSTQASGPSAAAAPPPLPASVHMPRGAPAATGPQVAGDRAGLGGSSREPLLRHSGPEQSGPGLQERGLLEGQVGTSQGAWQKDGVPVRLQLRGGSQFLGNARPQFHARPEVGPLEASGTSYPQGRPIGSNPSAPYQTRAQGPLTQSPGPTQRLLRPWLQGMGEGPRFGHVAAHLGHVPGPASSWPGDVPRMMAPSRLPVAASEAQRRDGTWRRTGQPPGMAQSAADPAEIGPDGVATSAGGQDLRQSMLAKITDQMRLVSKMERLVQVQQVLQTRIESQHKELVEMLSSQTGVAIPKEVPNLMIPHLIQAAATSTTPEAFQSALTRALERQHLYHSSMESPATQGSATAQQSGHSASPRSA